MELTASQIESIVRQVLAGANAAPAPSGAPANGKAKVAVLTAPKTIEIQEVAIPDALSGEFFTTSATWEALLNGEHIERNPSKSVNAREITISKKHVKME